MQVIITANESGTRTANIELGEAASHVAARGSYNHAAQILLAFAAADVAPKAITDDDGDTWNLVSHTGDDYTYELAEGACWPTEPDCYTVAFNGDAWSFFADGSVPEGWTVWQSGMTWAEAHDAINGVVTLTHAVINNGEDIGIFSDADTAASFAREGETVSKLETPVVRADCRPVDGTTGFGVW